MKLEHWNLVLAVAFSVANCFAVEFPLAAGGDIASNNADGWNGALSEAATEATFTGNDAIYTASADVSLGTVYIYKKSTFSLPEARKVSATKFYMPGKDVVLLLSGGMWDFSNGTFWTCGSTGAHAGNASTILSNRCAVSNVNSVRVSYKDIGNTLRIEDNASLSVNNSLLLGVVCGNNKLEILSGGKVTLGTYLRDGSTASGSGSDAITKNAILVAGEGSTLECGTDVQIGYSYSGNEFVVSNGATAKFSNLLIGSSSFRSSGNSVKFENANVSCKSISLATLPGSTNNSVWIGGSASVFTAKVNTVARYPIFGAGGYNRFTLADGAFWGYPLSMAMDTAASNNTLSVIGGAYLKIAGVLFSGTNHILSCDNTLYVGNGATAEAAGFLFGRFGNRIVVSNATLKATQSTYSNSGVRLGESLRNVDAATIRDNALVLQGNAPCVNAAQNVSILNGSELRFELPETGYAENIVPIQANSLVIDASSRLCATGVAALQKKPHARKIILAQTTSAISINAAVLTAANNALVAEGCLNASFVLSDDKKELALVAPRVQGFVLIIK